MKQLRGITNPGQWVSWNPDSRQMEIGQGGTWLIADGKFTEYDPAVTKDPQFLDAQGALLTPGLIDSHTHPAFAETRELEFEMRAGGKSYQEIAAAGGGIRNSVRRLWAIGQEELTHLVHQRFEMMLSHGTTTVECNSGYGLSTDAELKSLLAIRAAAADSDIQTIATLLGAHEIPDEYRDRREDYITLLIDEMIPRVAGEKLAEYCDVFCEEGVYTIDETRRILTAAGRHGLKLRFHADEFVSTGGAELAAELGASSADHLMANSAAGIQALAHSETVATLLPGTTFFLGSGSWAPARQLLDAGATIALATDFNPGSNMTLSLPFIMTLGVIYLHLTAVEALQAVTYGSAKALGLAQERGAIYPGYQADAVLWNVQNLKQLPYFYGINHVRQVLIAGKQVR